MTTKIYYDSATGQIECQYQDIDLTDATLPFVELSAPINIAGKRVNLTTKQIEVDPDYVEPPPWVFGRGIEPRTRPSLT